MSPMSFWKVVLLFIILGGQAMAEQLWSLQPLKRMELPGAGDAQSWDGHIDIAANHRQFALETDQGITALLADLKQRGLLNETMVLFSGEFGRTPRINRKAGRDHWVPVGGGLIAGGGMQTGQVIGSTTKDAGHPDKRPVKYQEILATVYHSMGIVV